MIELTQEQQHELAADEPVAMDPQTRETYVLVRRKDYERLKAMVSSGHRTGETMDVLGWEVPRGVQQSREAYLRDLPNLLADPHYHRQWVAYRGQEQIGVARSETALYQECRQRGLAPEEFYVGMVVPPLPQPETTDPSGAEYTEYPA